MHRLSRFLWILVYTLPAVLFFSYHPVISLGGNNSMNFELSLPLIWLVIFDLGSFVLLLELSWRQKRQEKTGKSSKNSKTAQLPGKTRKNSPNSRKVQVNPAKNTPTMSFFQRFASFSGITDRRFFLLALLPLYLTISILWSSNPLRGLLIAGVMWLVFFAIFALLYILPLVGAPEGWQKRMLWTLFISCGLVCIFCYVQGALDICGVSRDTTLMCLGCTYRSFGFPHPSGFAIEPQFMGNLLLAPTLIALYLLAFHYSEIGKRSRRVILILSAGLFSTTLFFTFSRGAIYAYGVAILVLLIFALKRKTFRWSLIVIPVVSFALSLGLQGAFAAVGPTTETFTSAITKSIHHLSLGIIDLRQLASVNPVEKNDNNVENCDQSVDKSNESCGKLVQNCPENVENPAQNCVKLVENSEIMQSSGEDTIFDGYVAESTNIRLRLNVAAFWTWLSAPGHQGTFELDPDCHHIDYICEGISKLTPTSVIFGVGLGGAGTALHAKYPDVVTSPKEIVQHQGFSLLLEGGLVGIGLVIFGLLVALFPQIFSRKFLDGKTAGAGKAEAEFWRHPALPLLLALIIAYLVTLNFFSGLPNALQIYLMPPLIYPVFRDFPAQKTIEQAVSSKKA